MNSFIIICLSIFFVINCSHNGGTTTVTNPDISGSTSSITVGKLNADGTVQITIPLSLFGNSEDDLNGASIDIYLNGNLRNAGLNPQTYYNASQEAVMFILSNINDGDVIMIVIHTADGSNQTYSGSASADDESMATDSTNPSTLFSGTPIHLIRNSSSDYEVRIPLALFGSFADLEDAQVTFRMTTYIDQLNIKTVSAASYYDTDTHEIVIEPYELWGISIVNNEYSIDPLDMEFCEIILNKNDGDQIYYSVNMNMSASKSDYSAGRTDYYLYELEKTNLDFEREYQLTSQTISYSNSTGCNVDEAELVFTEDLAEDLIITVDHGFVTLETNLDFIVMGELDGFLPVYVSDGYFFGYVRGTNVNPMFSYLQMMMEGNADEKSIDFTFTFSMSYDVKECSVSQHVIGIIK